MSTLSSGIGSAAGAALGSVVPGVGTAIGGLLGGLVGGGIGGSSPAPVVSPFTAQDAQGANAQTSMTAEQQQAFLNQLAAQNGTQNQSAVFNQLQHVADGQGPNPAQAMLANSTGANVAQQAALMAAQRGAGANAGLIARQAAMQGANIQQQAAGQGAALQAQQSLGALGQLGGIAGQQVGQQQQGLANQGQLNLGQMNSINNSISGANSATGNAQTPLNTINANASNQATAGVLNGASGAFGVLGAPQSNPAVNNAFSGDTLKGLGGSTQGLYAQGGTVTMPSSGPQSYIGKAMMSGFNHQPTTMMATGGKVPAMVSPGEKVLPPEQAKAVAQGKADPMKAQTVPGKATVKGDSLKNDTVPASLEEGSIVIPRSVLESKNPHEAAARFVAEHMKKMKSKSK